MKKDIRDKENELKEKWGYLRNLTKDHRVKRKLSYELYEIEDETYKKWKFFKGYLNAKGENKNEKDNKKRNN